MACTINPEEIKRVKGMGFLNNRGTDLFNGRIITVNGKITANQARAIAEAAEKFGCGEVEFTTRLTVELRGIPFDKIDELRTFLAQAGLETGGTGTLVRPVVSCKGTTCVFGLYDTFALAEKIHERFYKGYREVKLPHKFKIAAGGCPNNCVKPDLNDVGIVGQYLSTIDAEKCRGCKKCQIELTCPMKAAAVKNGIITIDDQLCNNCGRCMGKCPFGAISEGVPGYKMYIGGRWGKKSAVARPLSKIFTSEDELLDTIEKAILLFREQGIAGERFSDTINRLGFENVETQLLAEDLLLRKEQIIG